MRNLLIFILLLVGVYWVRRKLEAHNTRQPGPTPGAGRARAGSEGDSERMLACEVCGVLVPESEGVRAGSHFYCCEAHRRQAGG